MTSAAVRPVDSTRFGDRLRELVVSASGPGGLRYAARRSHVYNSGDVDENLYLVESGHVSTAVHTAHGKKCVLAIHARGEVFGEQCLRRGPRGETATAMTDLTYRRVPLPALLARMGGADLEYELLDLLTQRLIEQQQWIATLVTLSSEHRLAALLLRLARKLGTPQQTGVHVAERLTHDDLSAMVGTTRSRVGYFLNQFQRSGLINRSMVADGLIVDERRLAAYVDGVS